MAQDGNTRKYGSPSIVPGGSLTGPDILRHFSTAVAEQGDSER